MSPVEAEEWRLEVRAGGCDGEPYLAPLPEVGGDAFTLRWDRYGFVAQGYDPETCEVRSAGCAVVTQLTAFPLWTDSSKTRAIGSGTERASGRVSRGFGSWDTREERV